MSSRVNAGIASVAFARGEELPRIPRSRAWRVPESARWVALAGRPEGATRTATVALQFAVFLAAFFLLFRGWMGLSFVSTTFGSALWIAATGVTTSISARLGRMLPRRARAALRVTSGTSGGALLHPPKP